MKLNQHDLMFTIDLMNLMSQKIAVVSTEGWAADYKNYKDYKIECLIT